ncbi:hypothetical protein T484DRAFT_1772653, partial [Baffinella frigidus]
VVEGNSARIHHLRVRELRKIAKESSARIHHLLVRKIAKARQKVGEAARGTKRDIIGDYSTFASQARQKVGEAARGTKRDIIGDYSTFASKIYAPIKREGLRVDCDSYKFETRILENMNYSQ